MKKSVIVVLSTHWDREWYQTFQDYRLRLVKLLDHVIEGLRDGRMRGPFVTDGQAIVIDDYLEVRPQQREVVLELIRNGRLRVGPWYVNPDSFLCSGESLIRNIELGRRKVRQWGGKPSDVGFLCDTFGHPSQVPQLFAQFGFRGAMIWRGTNMLDRAHFRWQGADGTTMPTHRFASRGYCSYAILVRQCDRHDQPFDAQALRTRIDEYLDAETQRSGLDHVLIFDGGDHQGWDEQAYNVLMDHLGRRADIELIHGDLDQYVDAMAQQSAKMDLVLSGELREPGLHPMRTDQQWLIPGVLSSRIWIKQENAACQASLCQWAEPFGVAAQQWVGADYPAGFLDVAWAWLLQNHPHDSICGCSIDQVHRDMRYRFAQCLQIANRQADEAQQQIAAAVQGEVNAGELRVVAFNPLPRDVDNQVVELTLQIPADWPVFQEFFWFENQPAFRLFDSAGVEIPYQRLEQRPNQKRLQVHPSRFPRTLSVHEVRVAARLSIPATGYTTLIARRGELDEADAAMAAPTARPTRHPMAPGLAVSDRAIANDNLIVTVESDGSVTLTDRRSGQQYSRLLTFEDTVDIGDGWYHGPSVNDHAFSSAASASSVAVVHNGPMLASLRVRTVMSVPSHFDAQSGRRAETFVDLIIDSLLTLRAGSSDLEITTTVHNTARDHCLRVLMLSGATQATTYCADSAFDVVTRPIALRADNHVYRELEVQTKPQTYWTAVFQQDRGLAVIADGSLMETAVRDQPDRPIALTLLRATQRTVFTPGEPEGQLQGPLTFRYAVSPLRGAPDRVALVERGQCLAAGLRAVQQLPSDRALHLRGRQPNLPPTHSLLRVEGPAVLSSLRQNDGTTEARLFNPGDEAAQVTLHWRGRPGVWQLVDLDGRVLKDRLSDKPDLVRLRMDPKRIVTLRLS